MGILSGDCQHDEQATEQGRVGRAKARDEVQVAAEQERRWNQEWDRSQARRGMIERMVKGRKK